MMMMIVDLFSLPPHPRIIIQSNYQKNFVRRMYPSYYGWLWFSSFPLLSFSFQFAG